MLALTVRGTKCSILFMDDCEPNLGGFYCEVYKYDRYGSLEQNYCDYFFIHPSDCPHGCHNEAGGPSEEAEAYARDYVELFANY